MLNSIRSQLILASSILIILILGATAYFVTNQKIKEIHSSIFQNASGFSELTAERIVTNYEQNYRQKAFANFDRELSDIRRLNEDISGIQIYNYQGERLYSSTEDKGDVSPELLERVRAFHPSVKVDAGGRVAYLEKNKDGVRYTNFNGRDVDAIQDTEEIEDILYPFRDPNNSLRSYSVRYQVSYAYLTARVRETVTDILILALFGIAITLFTSGIIAGKITSPIHALSEGVQAFGKGDLTHRIDVKTKSEIGLLAGTFNQMATDLEKSTKQLVAKERQTKELELAGQIQKELLPKHIPQMPNLDLAASMSPADEIGGDCYDFIQIDENRLLFYIADVTGHGVPAGIVSAINNALVPALLEHCPTPSDLVIKLNRVLKQKTRPNVFVTMVMAVWDVKAGTLAFTQAGHDPILQYVSETKAITALASGGIALAMIPDISKVTKTVTVSIAAQDVFLLYTDGIPEAWANDKDQYGMDRLKALLQKHSTLPTAQGIHDAVLKEVREFMGTHPQEDDITLIVAKRTK